MKLNNTFLSLNQQKKSCNPITKESSRTGSFANYVSKWCCGDGLLFRAVAMAQSDILQRVGRPYGHARGLLRWSSPQTLFTVQKKKISSLKLRVEPIEPTIVSITIHTPLFVII